MAAEVDGQSGVGPPGGGGNGHHRVLGDSPHLKGFWTLSHIQIALNIVTIVLLVTIAVGAAASFHQQSVTLAQEDQRAQARNTALLHDLEQAVAYGQKVTATARIQSRCLFYAILLALKSKGAFVETLPNIDGLDCNAALAAPIPSG